MTPTTIPTPRVTIDHMAYPHIMDKIIRHTPFEFMKTLRLTSRHYLHRVDPWLFGHMATRETKPNDHLPPSLLLQPNLGFPLLSCDERTAFVQVLDASKAALVATPELQDHALAPRLIRFGLGGILGEGYFHFRAPIAVLFIAPQSLPCQVAIGDEIVTSDDPMFPPTETWVGHFRRANRIAPTIFAVENLDVVATERFIYNLRINPDHHMFGQWEIDIAAQQRASPIDIFILATCDCGPLPLAHQAPRGTPAFEGRILNRLLLCLGRQMARNFGMVRVTCIDANGWNPAWIASSYVDKINVFETDEDDLEDAETATMEERVQYWLNAAVENQYIQMWGTPFTGKVERYTRFLTLAEFRAEIPESDYVFQKILHP
jgi:hypothetical protein